jgi:hypothetical protein
MLLVLMERKLLLRELHTIFYLLYPKSTMALTLFGTDPDSPRLRIMVDKFYDQLEFPDNPDHFGDLAIYVKNAVTPSAS